MNQANRHLIVVHSVCLLAALCAAPISAGVLFEPPDEAIPWTVDVGSTKQLFLDDRLIVQAHNIAVVMTKPEKCVDNPVVIPDQPWERSSGEPNDFRGIQMGMQGAMYDEQEGLFKMWYKPWGWSIETERETAPWCYAVSKDGVHWEKPSLGIVDYMGSTDNNMMMVLEEEAYAAVIKTPHDPDPQRLYKAFGELEPKAHKEKHGACIAFSPDGVHWTRYEDNPVIKKGPDFADGSNLMGWDPRIGKYVAFLRTGRPSSRPQGKHLTRAVGYSVSEDFINWSPMKLMLTPNEQDPDGTEYELFSGAYDPSTKFYIGLMHYRHPADSEAVEAYLMSSRDGFRWTWVNRRAPFISFGEAGSYDSKCLLPSGPILHDGKMWIYYSARGTFYHPALKEEMYGGSIALATCPVDRYVGLRAGEAFTGRLVTRSLTFEGDKLFIDMGDVAKTYADTSTQEVHMRVGLLDYRGEPIPGFSPDDCQPFAQSGWQQVHWTGGSLMNIPVEDEWYTKDHHEWPGIERRVQIVFEYKNIVLYSFQFQE